MLVGVSHLSEAGFYHALEVSEKPIVATHSNCRSVYDHPRSLTDDQIKALASHGGVTGIQFLKLMLAELTLEHYLDHVDHACQLVGPKHVAATTHGFDPVFMRVFGNAFSRAIPDGQHNDGSAYHQGLAQLLAGLEKRGYDQEDIACIMGKNLLRVLAQALQ
jgi:membrane dipeptidase